MLWSTYKFLVDPFCAFGQKLEVWVGVDVQNIDQFSLKQSANVHPLFMDLLDSVEIAFGIISEFRIVVYFWSNISK